MQNAFSRRASLPAFIGGVLGLPLFTVVRQSLAVLVPDEARRTAYTMDSMGVELSFMAGPALGVAVATSVSTRAALLGVGVLTVAAGLAMMALNPPIRRADLDGSDQRRFPAVVADPPPAPRVRRWAADHRLLAIFAATAAAAMVLAGSDVGVVAHLKADGALTSTGWIFVAWGVASILGGLVYGAARRPLAPFGLLLWLALFTIPVGLAPGAWGLAIAILPAGALCAPVISATADAVSRLVPESVRGQALGWHGSALTVGLAVGAPLAGAAIDAWGAWSGFAVVGIAGLAVALAGLAARIDREPRSVPTRPPGDRAEPAARVPISASVTRRGDSAAS